MEEAGETVLEYDGDQQHESGRADCGNVDGLEAA